jgi:hypothetical protein
MVIGQLGRLSGLISVGIAGIAGEKPLSAQKKPCLLLFAGVLVSCVQDTTEQLQLGWHYEVPIPIPIPIPIMIISLLVNVANQGTRE